MITSDLAGELTSDTLTARPQATRDTVASTDSRTANIFVMTSSNTGLGHLPRELDAVDVEADWTLAQLDRALGLQMDRIDHLRTEPIDLFARTQTEPTSEVVVWFEPRSVAGKPANEGVPDDEKDVRRLRPKPT